MPFIYKEVSETNSKGSLNVLPKCSQMNSFKEASSLLQWVKVKDGEVRPIFPVLFHLKTVFSNSVLAYDMAKEISHLSSRVQFSPSHARLYAYY